MLPLQAPVSIEVDASGACTALLMQPQMISAYSRGRPGVVNAQKPVERLEADLIVAAVGQDVVSSPFEAFGMKTHWGAFTTDEFLAAEGFSNVFVGGDCQSGPTTVIKAVGAGKVNDKGERIPMDVQVGDVVIYGKFGGNEVKVDGEKYLLMRADDIYAVVEA